MKRVSVLALLAAAGAAMAQPAGTTYVAANWAAPGLINYLDSGLVSLGSFSAGNANPNGTAVNPANGEILVGLFSPPQVSRYTSAGVFVASFATAESSLQGMDMARPGELGIVNGSSIVFRNPVSGALIRTIPNPGGGDTEGLCYRGINDAMYCLNDAGIQALDAGTGTPLFTIPNPAGGSPFGGTALAYNSALDLLVVGDSVGNWWRINPLTGAVNNSGNNTLQMFGMSYFVPSPASTALLAFAGIAAGRRRRS